MGKALSLAAYEAYFKQHVKSKKYKYYLRQSFACLVSVLWLTQLNTQRKIDSTCWKS